MKANHLLATLAFGACLGVTQVQATNLVPGGGLSYPFNLPGGAVFASGTLVAHQQSAYASVPSGLAGTVDSWVYDRGAGLLDFWYRVNNAANSLPVHRFVVNGFQGYTTDVDFELGSPGSGPGFVDRSAGLGTTIGFYFINGVGPGGEIPVGGTSKYLLVRTNSNEYHDSTGAVIDGLSANMTSGIYAPVSEIAPPVPEPATMGLAGLALLGAIRRRRAAKA